jgi:hypothetical protein
MKKKLLIFGAVLIAISATGDAEGNIAGIIGDGFLSEATETRHHHIQSSEPMVMYNGDWIPLSTYDAFLDQIACVEVSTELASKQGRYFDGISEWIEWGDED